MAHPLLDRLSEPKVRWWIAGGVVVLALALGGFALSGRGDADGTSADGERLNIAVVAPPERDVTPGEVMEVGALNNGFDGRLPEAEARDDSPVDYYAEQPAYVESDRYADRPVERYDSRGDYSTQPQPAYDDRDRREPEGRPLSFGFDRRLPDWRAEREARRAAMEAREEARRQDRETRRYDSRGSTLDENQFY